MMGKIIGLASVGLLQFFIWIILISTLTFGVYQYFGIEPPHQQAMQQISPQVGRTAGGSEFRSDEQPQ